MCNRALESSPAQYNEHGNAWYLARKNRMDGALPQLFGGPKEIKASTGIPGNAPMYFDDPVVVSTFPDMLVMKLYEI